MQIYIVKITNYYVIKINKKFKNILFVKNLVKKILLNKINTYYLQNKQSLLILNISRIKTLVKFKIFNKVLNINVINSKQCAVVFFN